MASYYQFGKESVSKYYTTALLVSYVSDYQYTLNNCNDYIDSKDTGVYSPTAYSQCVVDKEFPDSYVSTVDYDNI